MRCAAWASLLKVDTSDTEAYKVRFNALTSRLLDNVSRVKVYANRRYVVFEPTTEVSKETFGVFRDGGRNAYCVSLNRLVNQERVLSKERFGKRYKVKKDQKGRIYICLTEEVEL